MSDTPRTDEAENNSMCWVTADFARTLERENFENQTRVEIYKLMVADFQKEVAAIQKRAEKAESELAALRGRLMEPVAWMYQERDGKPFASTNAPDSFDKNELSENEVTVTPLYAVAMKDGK